MTDTARELRPKDGRVRSVYGRELLCEGVETSTVQEKIGGGGPAIIAAEVFGAPPEQLVVQLEPPPGIGRGAGGGRGQVPVVRPPAAALGIGRARPAAPVVPVG